MPARLDTLQVDARSFADDVALLPAGTGHKRESASPDLRWGEAAEHDTAAAAIARVPVPAACPVYGEAGPMARLWRTA